MYVDMYVFNVRRFYIY